MCGLCNTSEFAAGVIELFLRFLRVRMLFAELTKAVIVTMICAGDVKST